MAKYAVVMNVNPTGALDPGTHEVKLLSLHDTQGEAQIALDTWYGYKARAVAKFGIAEAMLEGEVTFHITSLPYSAQHARRVVEYFIPNPDAA